MRISDRAIYDLTVNVIHEVSGAESIRAYRPVKVTYTVRNMDFSDKDDFDPDVDDVFMTNSPIGFYRMMPKGRVFCFDEGSIYDDLEEICDTCVQVDLEVTVV